MAGGCLGRAVGQLVQEGTGKSDVHLGVYALIGAAGQLSGITRMTVSLTLIMVEITNNVRLMLPLMLCVMVSKFIADRFTAGIFDVALELNGQVKMIDGACQEGDSWSDNLTVLDICSTEVVVLHCRERCNHIVKLLDEIPYHGFPLVEGKKAHVVGLVLRSRLLCAVSKHRQAKGRQRDYIDLVPYANLTPEVKHWMTPVSRVCAHFRSMGLQPLCVVDNDHGLMGLLTRTDISRLRTSRGRRSLLENIMWKMDGSMEDPSRSGEVGSPQTLGQLGLSMRKCEGIDTDSSDTPPPTDRIPPPTEWPPVPREKSRSNSIASSSPSRAQSMGSNSDPQALYTELAHASRLLASSLGVDRSPCGDVETIFGGIKDVAPQLDNSPSKAVDESGDLLAHVHLDTSDPQSGQIESPGEANNLLECTSAHRHPGSRNTLQIVEANPKLHRANNAAITPPADCS